MTRRYSVSLPLLAKQGKGFTPAPHTKPKPRCNTSTAFYNDFYQVCQRKMEKLRHCTQGSIFGVTFKLGFSQRKPDNSAVTGKTKQKRTKIKVTACGRTICPFSFGKKEKDNSPLSPWRTPTRHSFHLSSHDF